MHVVGVPHAPGVEGKPNSDLQNVLRTRSNLKVVLRVPHSPGQLTEEQSASQRNLPTAYNIIERELFKAGCEVRDRGLVEELLRKNPDADYKALGTRIDTDIIIEVVSLEPYVATTRQYRTVPEGKEGTAAVDLPMMGWRIEVRLILVESGAVGWIYTQHCAPENAHFILKGRKCANADQNGNALRTRGWTVDIDKAAAIFGSTLAANFARR